jgi:hypothetical protein
VPLCSPCSEYSQIQLSYQGKEERNLFLSRIRFHSFRVGVTVLDIAESLNIASNGGVIWTGRARRCESSFLRMASDLSGAGLDGRSGHACTRVPVAGRAIVWVSSWDAYNKVTLCKCPESGQSGSAFPIC